MTAPFLARWTGDSFEPLPRFHNIMSAEFVIGEVYNLVEQQERSVNSHNHYFASLHDLWLNVPEDQAERWQTFEHFRKWCLIKTGYADSRQLVCSSKAEARRVASFVRPCDEYAVVTVTDCVVTIYTAKSQSKKAMGNEQFQRSKSDVLDYAASMIGISMKQEEPA